MERPAGALVPSVPWSPNPFACSSRIEAEQLVGVEPWKVETEAAG